MKTFLPLWKPQSSANRLKCPTTRRSFAGTTLDRRPSSSDAKNGAKTGKSGGGIIRYETMLDSLLTTGFQATSLGMCIDEVNRMLRWRLSDEERTNEENTSDDDLLTDEERSEIRTKIFAGSRPT